MIIWDDNGMIIWDYFNGSSIMMGFYKWGLSIVMEVPQWLDGEGKSQLKIDENWG